VPAEAGGQQSGGGTLLVKRCASDLGGSWQRDRHPPSMHSTVPMRLELWLVFSHTAMQTPPVRMHSAANSPPLGRLFSTTMAATAVTTGIADLRHRVGAARAVGTPQEC